MATFGNACIDRLDSFAVNDQTLFDTTNPVSELGTLTSVCVYMSSGTSGGKIKVFRLNGSNYDFVGESASQPLSVGSNTFSGLSITIQPGDYIGVWTNPPPQVGSIEADSGAGQVKAYSGEVTTNTPTSEWDTWTYTISILATYTPTGTTDIYVNSSTGNDTYAGDSCVAGHPVRTFAKAYSLLVSGGTIHICNSGADFSGETVTLNKSFSVDLNGTSGYFYMPKAS